MSRDSAAQPRGIGQARNDPQPASTGQRGAGNPELIEIRRAAIGMLNTSLIVFQHRLKNTQGEQVTTRKRQPPELR